MFSKTVTLVLSSILLIFVVAFSAHAQSISTEVYETEEDLQEGLQSGYLTLDQYLELLDMILSKLYPKSEESVKLFFIPDISSVDILRLQTKNQGVGLSQKTRSFLERKKRTGPGLLSGRVVWRLYERFPKEERTESYFLFEIKSKDRMIWHMEVDQKVASSEASLSQGDLRVRKRFLKFLIPQYKGKMVLGNFDKRIGLGLNVGYHSLFGYGSESDFETEDTFLYPALGRFNGIYGEFEHGSFSFLAFYSKNKREKLENQIKAFDFSFVNKDVKAGVCISEGELKNIQKGSTFGDDCGSVHFDFRVKPIRLSGEYALLPGRKGGLAFDLYSYRKPYSFNFAWWRYQDGFIHPHGGGISNPDYESIYLEKIDHRYRAREAGERGIFFKSEYRFFGKFDLNFSYNKWRERSYLSDKMKLRIGSGYRLSSALSFLFHQLWTDYEVEDERIDRTTSSFELSFIPHQKLQLNFILNYRNAHEKDYGDLRLKIRTQTLSPFDWALWLKYNDPNFSRSADGCFSFYLQEKVSFFKNYLFSAEYGNKFYQDESKVDTEVIRIRMEALW